jgi:hypothetical protein
VLFFEQGIEHLEFAVVRVPFRVSRDAGRHPPARKLGDVLKQFEGAAVGAGSGRSIAADGVVWQGVTVTVAPEGTCARMLAVMPPPWG